MSKKPRNKKPGTRRVHNFTSKATLPIIFRTAPDGDRTLKLMPHADLEAIREGHGDERAYWCVTNRLNWASTLATMIEFSFNPTPTINAALDALMALYERFKQVGKLVLKGEELRIIGEALTLADDMHDATTRRQHRDALNKLMQQLPA